MRRHLVRPGTRVRLDEIDPQETGGREEDEARAELDEMTDRLVENRKWYRNLVVVEVLCATIAKLKCRYPEPPLSPAQLERIRIS